MVFGQQSLFRKEYQQTNVWYSLQTLSMNKQNKGGFEIDFTSQ